MAQPAARIWSGHTRFGAGWACFEGACGDAQPHRHLAAQLIVGQAGPVRVASGQGALSGDAVLVRAGALHAVAPTSAARVIYLQAFSPLGRRWAAFGRGEDLVTPPAELAAQLRSCADLPAALAELARACPKPAIDPRLAQALDSLADMPMRRGDIAVTAARIGLSEPRLRALAADQLGAPLSQWRLWFMIERALRALGAGETPAAAAALAGFSDQAHLSRAMRRFMGVTPRTVARVVSPPPGASLGADDEGRTLASTYF